jgi:hypothetical protein
LSAALLALNRHADAVSCCDKILERQPGDASALFNRGVALANLERPAEIFRHESNEDLFEKAELADYLDSIGVFERSLAEFVGREIEEIAAPSDQSTTQ